LQNLISLFVVVVVVVVSQKKCWIISPFIHLYYPTTRISKSISIMASSDMDMEMEGNGTLTAASEDRMDLSNAATTIDPSVITSRILQSASLRKQQQHSAVDDESMEQPHFRPISAMQARGNRVEYRRVRCPPHRYTPLREHWEQILTPLVEYLKLQVRRVWCCKFNCAHDEGIPTISMKPSCCSWSQTHFLPGSLVGVRCHGAALGRSLMLET
jgi:hypothetical protein